MFARIMAVVMAVILLTTVGLSAVWWLTLRNQQIDARLDRLISEAEDIAYLAGNLSGDSLMDTIRDRDSATPLPNRERSSLSINGKAREIRPPNTSLSIPRPLTRSFIASPR